MSETQAFLNLLVESIGTAKILLLVNYRPEYSHQWNSKTYYTQLRLDPLARKAPTRCCRPCSATAAELAPLKRLIIERTEGNPFFMEEMVLVLFDEGALVRNGAVKLIRSLNELKIPPTVQAILAARIDRLRATMRKTCCKRLAVIGTEFPLGLVSKVAASRMTKLEPMLSELQLGEFIYEQPATGDIEYTFKHALTQEVAYNSVLIERRKLLHERAGQAMESIFAGQLDDHLDELARHYSRSGNLRKAVEYLRLAAHQAAQRSSYPESIAYVNSALEILAGLPQSEQRDRDELPLRVSLGVSLMAAKGFDSDELERSFARGAILARDLKETIFLFAMLNGLWGFHFTRGHLKLALAISQELMAVAEQLNDPGSIRDAHSAMGAALGYAGDLLAARSHLEQAAALTNVPRAMGRPYRLGPDPSVLCLTALAGVLFELGYPDQALKRAYEAMAAVDADSDPFSLVMAMVFAAEIHCSRREAAKGEELARALLAICAERGYPFWQSVGRRMLGWALGQQGQVREAIELMEQEMQLLTGPQAQMVHIWVLLSIADCYEMIGEAQRALSLLDQWRAVRDKLELGMRDSFYYRLRARLFVQTGADDEAEKTFRKAIEAAVVRNARSEELRSTLHLARLLMKHGRRAEARSMLGEDLRLVHQGLRHRRFEGREGVARRAEPVVVCRNLEELRILRFE